MVNEIGQAHNPTEVETFPSSAAALPVPADEGGLGPKAIILPNLIPHGDEPRGVLNGYSNGGSRP